MNFEKKIEGNKLKLVDFWAPWCRYCILLEPTLEALGKKYSGDLEIIKINVDEEPEIAQKLGVRSLPTLKFFKDGKDLEIEVIDRSEDALSKLIEENR